MAELPVHSSTDAADKESEKLAISSGNEATPLISAGLIPRSLGRRLAESQRIMRA